jgi:hypothetical protein
VLLSGGFSFFFSVLSPETTSAWVTSTHHSRMASVLPEIFFLPAESRLNVIPLVTLDYQTQLLLYYLL